MTARLIYWFNAQGSDVDTLIHEGGHALHQEALAPLQRLLNAHWRARVGLFPPCRPTSRREITYSDTDTKVRYVAPHTGIEGEADLTIPKLSKTVIIADQTGVPDSMRGLGAGRALAERLIADARAIGQTIVPL
jgi:predicted GNAT family acetyltransferase